MQLLKLWKSVEPTVPIPYKNPMQLQLRGLLRARSRFPEIVGNIKNAEQRMEGVEGALAKQVLSQLSYTPIEQDLSPFANLFSAGLYKPIEQSILQLEEIARGGRVLPATKSWLRAERRAQRLIGKNLK